MVNKKFMGVYGEQVHIINLLKKQYKCELNKNTEIWQAL